jgi:hypothetical protein
MQALKQKGILTNADPYKVEKRGNILVMLMRAAINVVGESDYNYNIYDSSSYKSSNLLDADEFVRFVENSNSSSRTLEDLLKLIK